MSFKVYHKKKGKVATCERPDWTQCRDHNPSKGWSVERPVVGSGWGEININRGVVSVSNIPDDENSNITVEEYSAAGETEAMSSEYNERAASLRAENFRNIREKGLGSNFNVLHPGDSGRGDNVVWVGTCSECGARVFNREGKGLWEHEVGIAGGRSITKLECVEAVGHPVSEEKTEPTEPVETSELSGRTGGGETVANVGWFFNIADKIRNTVNPDRSKQSTVNDFDKDWMYKTDEPAWLKETVDGSRCEGFTAQGTPCTLTVAPQYSNSYCHQHYRQGFTEE